MAIRPSNVTNLHAIAFLYIAMGKDDGEITDSESELIVKSLFEYDSTNPEFIKQAIKESTDWYFSCADINEKVLIFMEMVDSLSSLNSSFKLAIINDLERIAEVDGVIHENEQVFYSYVLNAFNS